MFCYYIKINKQDFLYSLEELSRYLSEKKIDLGEIKTSNKNFPFLITKYYADIINWNDKDDPLRKMVLINDLENDVQQYELTDPIGDKKYSPVPGIIHKYENRCLLNLTNACAVHCRFCFRKNLLTKNKNNFNVSLKYLEKHEKIWEVILSGGDPFILTNFFLEETILKLKKIKHIKLIRFHTRVPTVYPKRVTEEFIKIIKLASPVIIIIHINHPKEITQEFKSAVRKLKQTNAVILSQSVLLKGINNKAEILGDLFKRLMEIGIKPYSLYHLDLTAGTNYFRTSIKEGKAIMNDVAKNISRICIPEYTVDIPGGLGKIPVSQLQETKNNEYTAINYLGKKVVYKDYYE